jgi:hypothetical protein
MDFHADIFAEPSADFGLFDGPSRAAFHHRAIISSALHATDPVTRWNQPHAGKALLRPIRTAAEQ